MKMSKYNVYQDVDDKKLIYNLLSKKFGVIDQDSYHSGIFDVDAMLANGFAVADERDESFLANYSMSKILHTKELSLTILVSENCNFRCEYCFDSFDRKNISESTMHNKCLESDICVISFDADEVENENGQVYVPGIVRNQLTTDKFGKLYQVKSPVLGIVGTSSQQGKFTLQMRLRKLFQENGYRVSQLSSEPEGCLFGVECVYPYGYNANVHLQGTDCIEHVNAMMHQMDVGDPDIIIVGAQAGVCVLSFENTVMYNMPTISFLLGAKPDAVVMCVNYHDEPDDILRAIQFTESLVDCKVIGISLFPLAYVSEWKYMRNVKDRIDDELLIQKTESLGEIIGIPAFVSGREEDEVRLFETIVDFFAEE